MKLEIGDTVPLKLLLYDGSTGKYPRAYVYENGNSTPLATKDLTHLANGLYENNSYTMPDKISITVVYVVFSDSGHTVEDDTYQRSMDIFVKDTSSTSVSDIAEAVWNDDVEYERWIRGISS